MPLRCLYCENSAGQTDRQTDRTTTITLAGHARRGLTILKVFGCSVNDSLVFVVVGPSCVSTFICGLEGLTIRLSSKSTKIVKKHSSCFPPGHKEGGLRTLGAVYAWLSSNTQYKGKHSNKKL